MNMQKPFTILAVLVFSLVALLHLLRLLFGWEVTFNGAVVPIWLSAIGLVVAGALAGGLWWESRK